MYAPNNLYGNALLALLMEKNNIKTVNDRITNFHHIAGIMYIFKEINDDTVEIPKT